MSTVFASITTPGPAGPPGRTALWLTGTIPPVTAQGLDGDMYLNDTNGDVYGPKNITWGGVVANIQGVPGGPGPAGPIGYSPLYIVAPGVPAPATGNNGDMYLNNTTSDLYGPKTAGAWGGIVANIRGTQGPPGVAYTPKGAWSAATTYAQGDMVTDGNIIYIALQSANLNHVPLTSPSWWQPATQGSSQWITTGSDIYYNVGRVGIGKIPAQYALEVVGTALTEISGGGKALCIPGAANLPSSFQLWKDPTPTGAANIGLGVPGGSASSDLVVSLFNAGWYERMRVTAAGNVGIGTTSPGSPLHVTNNGAASTSGQAVLILDAINDGGTIGSGPILAFATTGVPVCSIRSLTETAGAIGLAFATYSGSITEKVRITATGKVGIGTATPSSTLSVYTAGATVVDVIAGNNSGAVALLTYGNVGGVQGYNSVVPSAVAPLALNPGGGNVGIGTTGPTSTVSVVGGGSAGNANDATLNYNAPNTLQFASGIPGVALAGGVYTASPNGFWLQVRSSNSNGLSYPLLLNPLGGNVGIGTASPGYALDVTGDVNCTGAFRVNGTPISAGGGVTVRSTVIGGGITRAVGTVYRNTFGKPLMITVSVLIIAGATLNLNTDVNTTPSTVAASSSGNAGVACPCLTCWVLPNHYYSATVSSGATTIYSWNEWY